MVCQSSRMMLNASLNTLEISVGSEIITHILESKLPKSTLDKWETTLERDEFPKSDVKCMNFYIKAQFARQNVNGRKRLNQRRAKSSHLLRENVILCQIKHSC